MPACLHSGQVHLVCDYIPVPIAEPSFTSLPMWTEDQRLSRDPLSPQCQIGAAEAPCLMDGAAARHSALAAPGGCCRIVTEDALIKTLVIHTHSVNSVLLENPH